MPNLSTIFKKFRSFPSKHSRETYQLAASLKAKDIYEWLLTEGYFPESYVMPPCFRVKTYRNSGKAFYPVKQFAKGGVPRTEFLSVHFPKTELTDRTFSIFHPEIHHDIALHIARNWKSILNQIFSTKNRVSSYSFPLPIDKKMPGRLGHLRSGRMIYEYISMIDDDLASVAYQYTHLAHADVKNFYPSIYTHSIAWALHGKKLIRKPKNLRNFSLIGNRLDKLFQNANDGCTNGLPIGPVVSDIVAELILSAVDALLSNEVRKRRMSCKIVRFKDDYRFLAKSEAEAKSLVKILQDSLKQYNLELNEHKTEISALPENLFRKWVSKYHVVRPRRWKNLEWREFRELYLSVIQIDKECPNTGVIDRFLADIVDKKGRLRLSLGIHNLQRVTSMLLMLATLRVKAFPKIIAILEANMHGAGKSHFEPLLVEYLEEYLHKLAIEEARNKYLLVWICYFLSSNKLISKLSKKPNLKDPVVRSILNNRSTVFKACKEFVLFEGCVSTRKRVSMFEHLDIFNPPEDLDD